MENPLSITVGAFSRQTNIRAYRNGAEVLHVLGNVSEILGGGPKKSAIEIYGIPGETNQKTIRAFCGSKEASSVVLLPPLPSLCRTETLKGKHVFASVKNSETIVSGSVMMAGNGWVILEREDPQRATASQSSTPLQGGKLITELTDLNSISTKELGSAELSRLSGKCMLMIPPAEVSKLDPGSDIVISYVSPLIYWNDEYRLNILSENTSETGIAHIDVELSHRIWFHNACGEKLNAKTVHFIDGETILRLAQEEPRGRGDYESRPKYVTMASAEVPQLVAVQEESHQASEMVIVHSENGMSVGSGESLAFIVGTARARGKKIYVLDHNMWSVGGEGLNYELQLHGVVDYLSKASQVIAYDCKNRDVRDGILVAVGRATSVHPRGSKSHVRIHMGKSPGVILLSSSTERNQNSSIRIQESHIHNTSDDVAIVEYRTTPSSIGAYHVDVFVTALSDQGKFASNGKYIEGTRQLGQMVFSFAMEKRSKVACVAMFDLPRPEQLIIVKKNMEKSDV
jgi:hypothetical protein